MLLWIATAILACTQSAQITQHIGEIRAGNVVALSDHGRVHTVLLAGDLQQADQGIAKGG